MTSISQSSTSQELAVAPADVPKGLSTKAGLGAAAAAAVGGIISLFIDGDHTPETIMAFAMATVTLITVLAGRMAQAAAIYRSDPSPIHGAIAAARTVLPTDDEINEFEAARRDDKLPPSA